MSVYMQEEATEEDMEAHMATVVTVAMEDITVMDPLIITWLRATPTTRTIHPTT